MRTRNRATWRRLCISAAKRAGSAELSLLETALNVEHARYMVERMPASVQ
jgi:hypothetical protein